MGPASPAPLSSAAEASSPELPLPEPEVLPLLPEPEPEVLPLLPEPEPEVLPLLPEPEPEVLPLLPEPEPEPVPVPPLELDVVPRPPPELPPELVPLGDPPSCPEACGSEGDADDEQCRPKLAIVPARISAVGVARELRFIGVSPPSGPFSLAPLHQWQQRASAICFSCGRVITTSPGFHIQGAWHLVLLFEPLRPPPSAPP
jgi:hypothetical protein